MDPERLIADRARGIDASGVRRVFDLAANLKDPINLSIGQPDFPVPDAMKEAAIDAIRADRSGYTVTQGVAPLRDRISSWLATDLGWTGESGLLVTSGTSGGLLLAMLAMLQAGDEIIIPDPYFVMYPQVASMCDATPVYCDTYPDFRMTAERVEPLITARTKAVLMDSPSNPCGVVATEAECRDLLDLCRAKNVLLISDEIYDGFAFPESTTDRAKNDASIARPPSPARFDGAQDDVLLIRGFGKTYGPTGWRMGYAAGPKPLIEQMTKMQQYTFVCPPSVLQWGCIPALDVDMSAQIADYTDRRDLVVSRLSEVTEVAVPGGAFYAFVKIPDRLGIDDGTFLERCIERNVLIIPGNVFSRRGTHFRVSYATDRRSIERGLDVLVELLRG